ncbi:hypothetical protein BpHYR1_032853 [Brachionus plicatilis]|uniref:Uncharacterized protein n=1 Tax=Brachionus plicatilis TaxID=10195 RepID=A0A3M7Q543_BRAPC|nr:hypothetical protein BpHYR1_032853 [Brachionus plicatilis]
MAKRNIRTALSSLRRGRGDLGLRTNTVQLPSSKMNSLKAMAMSVPSHSSAHSVMYQWVVSLGMRTNSTGVTNELAEMRTALIRPEKEGVEICAVIRGVLMVFEVELGRCGVFGHVIVEVGKVSSVGGGVCFAPVVVHWEYLDVDCVLLGLVISWLVHVEHRMRWRGHGGQRRLPGAVLVFGPGIHTSPLAELALGELVFGRSGQQGALTAACLVGHHHSAEHHVVEAFQNALVPLYLFVKLYRALQMEKKIRIDKSNFFIYILTSYTCLNV